jgi:hypothetical protein
VVRKDAVCYVTSTRSIRLGSSAGARELLTRRDTGQRCSTSFAAGLSNAGPPSWSQDAKPGPLGRTAPPKVKSNARLLAARRCGGLER